MKNDDETTAPAPEKPLQNQLATIPDPVQASAAESYRHLFATWPRLKNGRIPRNAKLSMPDLADTVRAFTSLCDETADAIEGGELGPMDAALIRQAHFMDALFLRCMQKMAERDADFSGDRLKNAFTAQRHTRQTAEALSRIHRRRAEKNATNELDKPHATLDG